MVFRRRACQFTASGSDTAAGPINGYVINGQGLFTFNAQPANAQPANAQPANAQPANAQPAVP